jgi:electron transport complex protein RnfB
MTGLGGLVGLLAARTSAKPTVWQIDPAKCLRCSLCATDCVLQQSAVKCVHAYAMCGYCQLCTGYFVPDPNDLNTAAENQLCPTAAIKRTFVEDPYYEYTIDESLCIGCAKCVEGCTRFGNGSLHLQVRHDRCVNCNECSIARVCPGDAFVRLPADQPYLLKTKGHGE